MSVLTGGVTLLFFFVKNALTVGAFTFAYSHLTFFISLILAFINTFSGVFTLKVLAVGDLSVYSVFMMLGNIICPVITGMLFFGEAKDFTFIKGISLAIMIFAIALSVKGNTGKKLNVKALSLYMIAFLVNGLNGALYTVHQNNAPLTAGVTVGADGNYIVNSDVFVCWNGITRLGVALITFIVILAYKAYQQKKGGEELSLGALFAIPPSADSDGSVQALRDSISKKRLLFICICFPIFVGICNGVGNYFIAVSTVPEAIGSLASYPVVNGGTIVFSTLVGLLVFQEKINKWKVVSTILILLATILFIFA